MNNYYLYAAFIFGFLLLGVLVAYFPRMIAWFGFLLPYEHLHNDEKKRIAVLVPARNESAVISPLLDSLSQQTYSNFEVFVIVKDPRDATIALAQAKGFHVHVALIAGEYPFDRRLAPNQFQRLVRKRILFPEICRFHCLDA